MSPPIAATPANWAITSGENPTAPNEARTPELTPSMPSALPCLAVVCEPKPESEPMHKTLLVKYPAWTRPAIPVLAAARNPPVNTTAGAAYNHEYSGGSVGPVDEDAIYIGKTSQLVQNRRTFKHIQHPFCYDETPSNVDTC